MKLLRLQNGFIPLLIVAVIAVVGLVTTTGAVLVLKNKQHDTSQVQQENINDASPRVTSKANDSKKTMTSQEDNTTIYFFAKRMSEGPQYSPSDGEGFVLLLDRVGKWQAASIGDEEMGFIGTGSYKKEGNIITIPNYFLNKPVQATINADESLTIDNQKYEKVNWKVYNAEKYRAMFNLPAGLIAKTIEDGSVEISDKNVLVDADIYTEKVVLRKSSFDDQLYNKIVALTNRDGELIYNDEIKKAIASRHAKSAKIYNIRKAKLSTYSALYYVMSDESQMINAAYYIFKKDNEILEIAFETRFDNRVSNDNAADNKWKVLNRRLMQAVATFRPV